MSKAQFYEFTGPEGQTHTLSLKEKAFCEHYIKIHGNGTKAIKKAGYSVKNDQTAASMAYENLRKPQISAYINHLLSNVGFTDENADKQLLYLINQFTDYTSKLRAIKVYNKLKGRYSSIRRQFEDQYEEYSDEEMEEALAQRIAEKVSEIISDGGEEDSFEKRVIRAVKST